jgi:sigma-B regulation protein RsbU (phosphoserine phosphatase)
MESTEAKLLYRRLDILLGTLDPNRPPRDVLKAFLEELFQRLRDDLRLAAAVLFDEHPGGFDRIRRVGSPAGRVAEHVEASAPWIRLLMRHRSYVFARPEAPDSPQAAGALPAAPAAAILIGDAPQRHVFCFLFEPGWVWDKVDFTLNTIRVALSARLNQERVHAGILQAAEIQKSLLVDEPPPFPGYELACRSVPTELVGGDFYDFIAFDTDILGLAIGDASGHGLPAALLVRDVVTGLRMGIEKDMKVGYAFRKLNRVIHRSRLSSRFVSVFYGELEPDGNLIYVNAGHQPPLLFSQRRVERLELGGTVIGPLPEARFELGGTRMEPGSTLVLCTDGVLERRDAKGEFFGEERLASEALAKPMEPSQQTVARVFQIAFDFGGGRPWEDDATLLIVRRLS